MGAELCETSATSVPTPARRRGAVILADVLPLFGDDAASGGVLDPSPLRGLSPSQRERRLVGMLEVLASWGDGSAAGEALRHHRWQVEMRRGKAPQRVDLNATGSITVLNTLTSKTPETQLPPAKRRPQGLAVSQERPAS